MIVFSSNTHQRITVSTTLNKPGNSTKLAGTFQVCEAEDETLSAIEARIDEADSDSLFIHCLFEKEMFSLYTLLRVSIDPVTSTELVFERVSMFAFPVYASKLVSDATC